MISVIYKIERKKRGTQQEVAKLLCVTQETISRRETGKLDISKEAELALLSLKEKHTSSTPTFRKSANGKHTPVKFEFLLSEENLNKYSEILFPVIVISETKQEEIWDKVNAALADIATKTKAPSHESGKFNKIRFCVTFSNGETCKGSFNLRNNGLGDNSETLREQIRNCYEYFANKRRPHWMSDKQWEDTCRTNKTVGSFNDACLFLESYDI